MNQSDQTKKRRVRITEKKKKSGGKICPKGIAWAKRTFDTYPSAYANLAASKYCKDPNYGKGRGKDAKNEELDPLLEEEEDSVDLSDQEVNKLKKVQGQLKKSVKAHDKQQKVIGDMIKEGELQKWVDEDWVRVTSSGKIAGKCGTSKDKKNPDRCLPRSKAQSLSKKERAATGKKKKAAQKSGKDSGKKSYVANTKKGKVTKKHTKRESLNYFGDPLILESFKGASLDDGTLVCEACLFEQLQESSCGCPDLVMEAKYQGRTVTLNKPTRGDVKKFKVYVRDPKTGNVKKVNFGDPNMKIKKSNPKRRKSFRARHNCDNPGPKTKARYWSCKKW